jgi:hypothetical protein
MNMQMKNYSIERPEYSTLMELNGHYRTQKRPPLILALTQINQVHSTS